jgi:hypothetical protein
MTNTEAWKSGLENLLHEKVLFHSNGLWQLHITTYKITNISSEGCIEKILKKFPTLFKICEVMKHKPPASRGLSVTLFINVVYLYSPYRNSD